MKGSTYAIERWLKVDDPVGAVSVHGAAGIWGLLSIGFFADGSYGNYTSDAPFVTGLFYGGWEQLIAQLISAVIVVAWSLGAGLALFFVLKKTMGIRASREEELEGLDIPEHGVSAYPEFVDTK